VLIVARGALGVERVHIVEHVRLRPVVARRGLIERTQQTACVLAHNGRPQRCGLRTCSSQRFAFQSSRACPSIVSSNSASTFSSSRSSCSGSETSSSVGRCRRFAARARHFDPQYSLFGLDVASGVLQNPHRRSTTATAESVTVLRGCDFLRRDSAHRVPAFHVGEASPRVSGVVG
jgi:hypothetical protein